MPTAKRVIPCLDVDRGRVVKGVRFREIRDAGDPAEVARTYNREGADELVMLDITASHEARDIRLRAVEAIADTAFIPLTVGGGVRSLEDIDRLLRAGADKTSINSAALDDPSLLRRAAERFGSQCIVAALDAKRAAGEPPRWQIFSHGGRRPTGRDAVDWARKAVELGAGEILLTSMDRDGTRLGFDLALTRAVSDAVPVPVIASGGVGRVEHLADGVLEGGADAVLAASVFHFGEWSIADAKAHMRARGIAVRG